MKVSDEMVERARLAYAAAIPGMFVNRTDDEPKFVDAWRAAIAAAIGDMVLVPREPTEKMMVSALRELWPIGELVNWDDGDPNRSSVRECYVAMIAVSQPLEAGEGRER